MNGFRLAEREIRLLSASSIRLGSDAGAANPDQRVQSRDRDEPSRAADPFLLNFSVSEIVSPTACPLEALSFAFLTLLTESKGKLQDDMTPADTVDSR